MLEPLASRFTRCARVNFFNATVGLCLLMGGSQGAHAQGFFEALFGRSEPSFAPTLTIPQESRRSLGRRPSERSAALSRSSSHDAAAYRPRRESMHKPEPYRAPEVMPGPLGRFLNDPTLRRGDVVATADGLMVYRGGASARHRPSEFVAVQRAGSLLAQRTRNELAKVEVAAGVSYAEPSAPAQFVGSYAPVVAQDNTVRLR